jgi:hypothetical protein
MLVTEDGTAGAYVGFFDTEFKGSAEMAVKSEQISITQEKASLKS